MNDPLTSKFNYEEDFKYDTSNDDGEEFVYESAEADDLVEPTQEVSEQLENTLQLNTGEADVKETSEEISEEYLSQLFKAASSGDIDTLTFLQPSFTQSNETNKRSGITPLHAASSNGHLDVVKYLIEEAGAIVELEDREGETALLRASHKPANLPIVTYLLGAGANVAHLDNDGWNALHNASANGSEDAVRAILNNANKEIIDSVGGLQDGPGYTPLMNAASRGHLDVVRYLLTEASAPADPFIRNKSGATAYSLAAESLNFDICEVSVFQCDTQYQHCTSLYISPRKLSSKTLLLTTPSNATSQYLSPSSKISAWTAACRRWQRQAVSRAGPTLDWDRVAENLSGSCQMDVQWMSMILSTMYRYLQSASRSHST